MRPAVPKRLDIVSNGRIGFPPLASWASERQGWAEFDSRSGYSGEFDLVYRDYSHSECDREQRS